MLSALEAFRRGRKIVPDFLSGALVRLVTLKGLPVQHGRYNGGWSYVSPNTGSVRPLDHTPKVGSACILGAQAVAMGFGENDDMLKNLLDGSIYVHPDFMLRESDRVAHPFGALLDEFPFEDRLPESKNIASNTYPCQDKNGERDIIPSIVAHLNDVHDPRNSKTEGSVRHISDPFSEAAILTWLEGMGYNGSPSA